jgi:hypothetical protein
MKIIVGPVVLFLLCACGCNRQKDITGQSSFDQGDGAKSAPSQREEMEAERLASKIHVGMTFAEVSQIIPIRSQDRSPTVEHGGVWYNVATGKNYYLQLRFERSGDHETQQNSRLNLAPRVKKH